MVHLVETTYERHITRSPQDLKLFLPFWQRSETLPWWDVTVGLH
jgi:hypothetical protein